MKLKKCVLLWLIGMLITLSTTALSACAEKEEFTGFLKGTLADVILDKDLEFCVKEYADIVTDSEYTIVVSKADGSWSKDITENMAWIPYEENIEHGAYKLIYTIQGGVHKGTYVYDFNFLVPKLKVAYTLEAEDLSCHVGDTLIYQEYFDSITINVDSYYDYSIRPDYVWIGEDEVNLTGTTQFTFERYSQHTFHFTVVTKDNQTYPIILCIKTALVTEEAKSFMSANNVVAYGYDEITSNMGITFDAGDSCCESDRQNLPYLSFKGNYGAGTYAKFDFTGNNLPKVAFFSSKIEHMLNDGTRGLYIGNGHWHGCKEWQDDSTAFTVYGPNKVSGGIFSTSADDVLWHDDGAEIAGAKLEKNPETKYQYLIGIAEAKDASQVAEDETPYCVVEALLYDRDTLETIYECSQKIESDKFVNGYFSGNIVVYANFGHETTFDKVYPLQTATSVYDLYEGGPKFGDAAVRHTYIGAVHQVSGYAPEMSEDYVLGYVSADKVSNELFYTDNNGAVKVNTANADFVDLSDQTSFTFPAIGKYIMYYQVPNRKRPSQLEITVSGVKLVDFENGIDTINVCEMSSEDVTINGVIDVSGNKMMSVSANWSTYIGVSAAYVQAVFADEKVSSLQFKLYTDKIFATNVDTGIALAWYFETDDTSNLKTNGITYTDEGDYLLINWTREGYNDWTEHIAQNTNKDKDVCQFLFRLGEDNGDGTATWSKADTFYLDDFTAYKEPQWLGEETAVILGETQEDYVVELGHGVTNVKLNGKEFLHGVVTGGVSFKKNLLVTGDNILSFNDANGDPYQYNVKCLPSKYDFEDGKNDVITAVESNDSANVVGAQGTTQNGVPATDSYTVKYDPGDLTFVMGIDARWIQAVMTQTNATGIQFKIYTEKSGMADIQSSGKSLTAFRLGSQTDSNLVVWSGWKMVKEGDYFVFKLTRAACESWLQQNENSSKPTNVMTVQIRLGVLDTDPSSKTYNKIVWGACDFVYIDDLEATLP